MITRTKNRIQKSIALLACLGSVVSLSGCFASSSCMVATHLAGNSEINKAWNGFKNLTTLQEAKDLCWRKVPLTLHDGKGVPQSFPIEFGFEMIAKEGDKASDVFAEMLRYTKGSTEPLSDNALSQERFMSDYAQLTEGAIMKEARFRAPIYKFFPQLKATARAVQAFCEQTAKLRDGKEEGLEATQRLLALRDIAIKKHDELKMLFSTPALLQAGKNACTERGLGESEAADLAPVSAHPDNTTRAAEVLGSTGAAPGEKGSAVGGARETYPPCSTNPGVSPCSF